MAISWKRALALETKVAQIIHQQEITGFQFDLDKAYRHITTLDDRQEKLYNEIRPYLTTEIQRKYKTPINAPYLKNGDLAKSVITWFGDNIPNIGGPFSRVAFVDPDLGSRQKLIQQLLKQGWKPTVFTDKGMPKLTEAGVPVRSLDNIDAPVGKALAEWYVLNHRKSQIQGWINRVRPDGRITAGANSCGTNTARMKHRGVVNIPKASKKVVFGHEMRDLFIARDGFKIVGHDASGLEARMMAHYTFPYDNGEFAREILDGDVHTKNALAFFPEQLKNIVIGSREFEVWRDLAKTLFYGIIYGAQPAKVGRVIGGSRSDGERVFEAFWEANPGLGALRKKVIAMAERNGWVPGLDGRKIYIRSSHSAMNALFQSGGAIVMKVSMVILDHWVKQSGIEAYKVADMHDEAQCEVPESDILVVRGTKAEVERSIKTGIWTPLPKGLNDDDLCEAMHCMYGEFAVKSIRQAGVSLGLRCALDAEYKVGNSWAETH